MCEPPSIPLSFSLATVLPRRSTYHFRSGCDQVDKATAKCSSFRARTTGVSNPVCSPGFRASASVTSQQVAFATGVPPDIYAFHRYTWSSTCPSRTLAHQYRVQFLGWAEGFHTRLNRPPTRPLSPVIPSNVCHLRLTAAAGTELAVTSFGADVKYEWTRTFPHP